MRLQLGIVLALVLVAVPLSSALAQEREAFDGSAKSRTLIYADDDATTVVTTIADAELALPQEVSIGAHVLLDAVSSASVDVVSAATERWTENRVELGLRAGYRLSEQDVAVALVRSEENDWRSYTASLATAREFFERNTKLSASYAYTQNQVGRASDPSFEKALNAHSLMLGLGQLLDRKTRVGVGYDLQLVQGFQSSPYRYVSAVDGTTMAERHPDSRQRHALSSYLVRYLYPGLAARASYRIYRDDWGILAHTAALGVNWRFASRFQAGLEGRFYQQNKADFYKNSYPTSFRFMSGDRELSTFWDLSAQAKLAAQVGPVQLDAKLGVIHYRFRNFDPLARRRALLLGAGARMTW